MADDQKSDDPTKVKQLLEWATRKSLAQSTGAVSSEPAPEIDETTRQQLEAWFGVPSYQAIAEKTGKPIEAPEDPEMAKVRVQREAALAAIEPAMLDAIHRRVERCDTMRRFTPTIDLDAGLAIDPDMPFLDVSMINRVGAIADPREIEIPAELQDDLRDCTPQALLRDLHRAETDFDKQFERVDVMLEHRVDISGLVSEAMRTSWALPHFGPPPFVEGTNLLREIASLRRMPWTDIPMPNRRVKE
ncbi:MAG: hypothetical protein NT062_34120 [Proteobacteria bacterium]|nr:hypothetical protein [Pseudomonadota bacterium]